MRKLREKIKKISRVEKIEKLARSPQSRRNRVLQWGIEGVKKTCEFWSEQINFQRLIEPYHMTPEMIQTL